MNKINETIKKALVDMTKELKLNKYPTVNIEHIEGGIMAAGGTIYRQNIFLGGTIIKTECDYVLRINKKATNNIIKRYTIMFGNKQAAYDCVYLLVCHECRHMWQYQEQTMVGKRENYFNITELFDGHGADPIEQDANKWMISVAERKGLKNLATYIEMEQRQNGLSNMYNVEFKDSMHNSYLTAVNTYNKALSTLITLLKW